MQLKQDNSMVEDFKILKEIQNPLFNRKEIQISIKTQITPRKEDAEKLICEKFSTQLENIKIKKIIGKFGSKIFTITTNIYKSKQDKENTEPKLKKQTEETKTPKEVIKKENKPEENKKE